MHNLNTIEVDENAQPLCGYLITNILEKFHHELNSSVYKVINNNIDHLIKLIILIFYYLIQSAAILKVSTLKYWIGRPWSKGSFTGGISSLAESADQYLFKSQKEPTEISQENLEDNVQENNPVTPNLKTPASVTTVLNAFFRFVALIKKKQRKYW